MADGLGEPSEARRGKLFFTEGTDCWCRKGGDGDSANSVPTLHPFVDAAGLAPKEDKTFHRENFWSPAHNAFKARLVLALSKALLQVPGPQNPPLSAHEGH